MFHEIAYYQFLGLPLVAYGGLVVFLSFLLTASVSYGFKREWRWIPMKWHPRLAAVSLVLALFHGLLGLLANIGS